MTKEFAHKLTAILNGDVAGYSRHMSEDEVRTVRVITAYRAEISKLCREYGGRIVDFVGDNMLVEFGSALDAVVCGVRIQSDIERYNEKFPDDQRMRFRIGIHLGDMMIDGDRIYGEGVNIASRLESLAEPGGICISDMVYRQVRNKVDHTFEDLGDKTVKNIPEPVRVFRILMDEDAASRARAGEGAARGAAVFLPEKPSLAVLPFVNPSGDREQDYFADGLTMEIMTSLIKIPRLFSSRIRRSSPSSRSPFRLGSSAARWEFATCSREACGKRATG